MSRCAVALQAGRSSAVPHRPRATRLGQLELGGGSSSSGSSSSGRPVERLELRAAASSSGSRRRLLGSGGVVPFRHRRPGSAGAAGRSLPLRGIEPGCRRSTAPASPLMRGRQAGVGLPHQSRAQYASTPRVPRQPAQPGDLIFFYSPISHVSIYLGNGMHVHAPNTGSTVSDRLGQLGQGHRRRPPRLTAEPARV